MLTYFVNVHTLGLRAIFVANLNDAHKRSLLIGGSNDPTQNISHASSQLQNPRSIVVDPVSGIMIWTAWPEGPPTIFNVPKKHDSMEAVEEPTSQHGGKLEAAWLDGTHRYAFKTSSEIRY